MRNGKIVHWKCINAGAMVKANEVESYFSAKGTQNMPQLQGANIASKWVYIFKLAKPKGLKGMAGSLTGPVVYNYVFED